MHDSTDETKALARLEASVFDLSTQDDVNTALDLLHRAQLAASRARDIKSLCEGKLAEWIDKNGEINLGEVRYYVGTTKTHKPKDIRGAVADLLDACHGDLDAFCDLLSSNPFKCGEVKKALQDKFEQSFLTEFKLDLRTGKPARELKQVNTRFLPKETK